MIRKYLACEAQAALDYLQKIESALANPEFMKNKPEVAAGLNPGSENPCLTILGDTAIISVNGFLNRMGPNWIHEWLGIAVTGYNSIISACHAIMGNPDVKNVRVEFNTPGGQVDGLDEAFQALRSLSDSRDVISVNRGLMASGGYWLACAAPRIISTSPLNLTGSIGVIIVGIDSTKFQEEIGIVEVVLISENAPGKAGFDDSEGVKAIQEFINASERVFMKRIAESRGKTREVVAKTFGRGNVLVAVDPDTDKPSAISVGMIDAVEELFASQAIEDDISAVADVGTDYSGGT